MEVVFERTNKNDLGLSKEDQKRIGDNPVYNIYFKVNNEIKDWSGQDNIELSIAFNKDGQINFTTKHLSDYGVVYMASDFDDIQNHWAREAIEALAAREIIKGVNKHEFRPEDPISRADLVTLMIRFFEFQQVNNKDVSNSVDKGFDDVDYNKYYTEAITVAKEIGLVNGCGDNLFKPHDSISREDMAVILCRCMDITTEFSSWNIKEQTYLKCSDYRGISKYAVNSVEKIIDNEILNKRLNKICPNENATRAEVANALYNIMRSKMN